MPISEGSICFIFISFQKIAEMAHAHGALLMVDNSIMSPVLSRPLELGAGMFCLALNFMLYKLTIFSLSLVLINCPFFQTLLCIQLQSSLLDIVI